MATMIQILMAKANGQTSIAQAYGLSGALRRRSHDAKIARRWAEKEFPVTEVKRLSDVAVIELWRAR